MNPNRYKCFYWTSRTALITFFYKMLVQEIGLYLGGSMRYDPAASG